MPRNRSEKVAKPAYTPAMITWALLCEKRRHKSTVEHQWDVLRQYEALPMAAKNELYNNAGVRWIDKALYIFRTYGRGPDAT